MAQDSYCTKCNSLGHLAGQCFNQQASPKPVPKEEVKTDCNDCPYKQDAEKWRKQQAAKKTYMRKKRSG